MNPTLLRLRETIRAAAQSLACFPEAAKKAPFCTCGKPDCKSNAIITACKSRDRQAIDDIVDGLSEEHLEMMATLLALEALLR